jgi:TnsA endonuclease-like protein
MAKRKRFTTTESIRKRIREGRGKGRLAAYSPWLHIQDVASRGLVTRIRGWKSGRVHHVLSLLELRCLYALDWRTEVLDIREQYPLLPLEETIAIAAACGIKHPRDPRTSHPFVMTTDFVATVLVNGVAVDQALCVKYSADLDSARTREKLEIERHYWEERKVEWKIVTEHDLPKVRARNIEWVHAYQVLEDFCALSQPAAVKTIATLTKAVLFDNRPLRHITDATDARLKLEPGTSLSLVRYLIATRRWLVNMDEPIQPGSRLVLVAKPALAADPR